MLLRAGATISPRNAARPSRQFLEDVRMMRVVSANIRIAAAEELSTYLGNILAAGSFAKYDASRRAPFVAMLERVGAFPIPNEMIAIVCAFWLRTGEYYGGVDDPTPMHEATKENLLALIAESDNDEDAWAADLEEELFS